MKKIGGIFTGPIVSWFDEAEKRLEELKGFREDWDSYGGLPITCGWRITTQPAIR